LDKPAINKLIADIDKVQKKIDANPNNNDEPTEGTSTILSHAYKIIEKYSDELIIAFDKEYPEQTKIAKEDKKAYACVSKTEKKRSVIEVWKEFFAGEYAGGSFVFWIILAALVDIAGFIFFDIAFKRKVKFEKEMKVVNNQSPNKERT
jgi:hypothetical protein